MPRLELEFEVYCAVCGAGLCNQTTEGRTPGRGFPYITVQPCPVCLKGARDEGYDEGYSKGYDQGCADTEDNHALP